MQSNDFEALVKAAVQQANLPQALEVLKASENPDVAEVAKSLSGQFALATVDGEERIYHVFEQANDDGEMEEYVEHIMNEGDDPVRFVAWFFDTYFDIKNKETYAAAGKTYQQPKRS
ncbi:MAG: hypothetical protein ACPHV3_07930 [Vibrio sp.]